MKSLQEIWTKNGNNPHLLTSFDEYTKKYYMVTLISVAQIHEKNFADKMKSIKQFCNVVGYIPETPDMTQEDKLAKTMSSKQLEDCTFLFRDNDIGKLLILDCLILTMTSDTDFNSTAHYISDLAKLYEIDSNTMLFLSNLAAVISSGDLSKYNCDISNTSELYQYYLDGFDFSTYRRLFNADRVVKMWFDEQKKLLNGGKPTVHRIALRSLFPLIRILCFAELAKLL